MAAVDLFPGRRSRGFRARRPVRAVLFILVLGLVAGLVWASVLHTPGSFADRCQPAAEAAGTEVTPGHRLRAEDLDGVPPAPPRQVRVQVLNANGKRGEAAIVGGKLSELGFAPNDRPANDPLHPSFDLPCQGEIRFGAAGQAAARTLSLVLPCAELVRDVRPDGMVDLALGTKFTAVRPNNAANAALQGLARIGQPTPSESSVGGLAAQPAPQSITQPVAPVVDPDLFRQAHQVPC
ncbi:MAG TPA: envelope integrity protein Cei [Pseudonocardiaceae bacterium]